MKKGIFSKFTNVALLNIFTFMIVVYDIWEKPIFPSALLFGEPMHPAMKKKKNEN